MPENHSTANRLCGDESADRRQAADLTREIMAAEGISCGLSAHDSAAAQGQAAADGSCFSPPKGSVDWAAVRVLP